MGYPVTTRGPQTPADWAALNPVLNQFELGIEIDPATGQYGKTKLGDGRTAWNDLAYASGGLTAAEILGLPSAVPPSDARFAFLGVPASRIVRVHYADVPADLSKVLTVAGIAVTFQQIFDAVEPDSAATWAESTAGYITEDFLERGFAAAGVVSAVYVAASGDLDITLLPGLSYNALAFGSTDVNVGCGDWLRCVGAGTDGVNRADYSPSVWSVYDGVLRTVLWAVVSNANIYISGGVGAWGITISDGDPVYTYTWPSATYVNPTTLAPADWTPINGGIAPGPQFAQLGMDEAMYKCTAGDITANNPQVVTVDFDFSVSDPQNLLPAVPTGKIRIPVSITLHGAANANAADNNLEIGWNGNADGLGFAVESLGNLTGDFAFISTQYGSVAPAEAQAFNLGTADQVLTGQYQGTPIVAVVKLDITYIDRDA